MDWQNWTNVRLYQMSHGSHREIRIDGRFHDNGGKSDAKNARIAKIFGGTGREYRLVQALPIFGDDDDEKIIFCRTTAGD